VVESSAAFGKPGVEESKEAEGLVHLLALFVRSARLPALPASSSPLSLRTDGDELEARLARHPAVLLINSCEGLLREVLGKYPGDAVAGAVGYLMTSLVTFIVPAVPLAQVPAYMDFLWTRHMKNLVTVNFAVTCDFVTECVEMLGFHAELAARAAARAQRGLTAHTALISPSANAEEDRVILTYITDMLCTLAMRVGEAG